MLLFVLPTYHHLSSMKTVITKKIKRLAYHQTLQYTRGGVRKRIAPSWLRCRIIVTTYISLNAIPLHIV